MSLLPPVTPALPICSRKVPSLVNLSTWWLPPPLPAIQTLSLWSTKMPCSLVGHSQPIAGVQRLVRKPGSAAPPQARSRLPRTSNCITEGAGKQHSERGGVCAAPASSAVNERRALDDPDRVVAIDRDARDLADAATGWAAAFGQSVIDLELGSVTMPGAVLAAVVLVQNPCAWATSLTM